MLKALTLIFPALLVSLYASAQNNITVEDASKHIGENVTICDKIYESEFMKDSKTRPTFLKMGGVFPKHMLTVLINFKDRKNFSDSLEKFYLDKDVCITGKLIDVKGKPQLIISKPTQIQIGTE